MKLQLNYNVLIKKITSILYGIYKSKIIHLLLVFFLLIWVVVNSVMRVNNESNNKTIEIALDWDEILELCQKNKYDLSEFLARATAIGVSSIVLNEETLSSLISQEKVIYFSKSEYNRFNILDLINQESILKENSISVANTNLENQIVHQLEARYGIDTKISKAGKYKVITPSFGTQFVPSFWSESIPLGFSNQKIQFLSDMDMGVIYRLQNVGNPQWLFESNKSMNFLGFLWDGKEISGYSGKEDFMIENLRNNRIKYINLEFMNVLGIERIKRNVPELMITGHCISTQELNQNQSSKFWTARWLRAVKERSIRFLFFHFWQQKSIEENISYLREVGQKLRKNGYKLGISIPPSYPMRDNNSLWLFLAIAVSLISPLFAIYYGKLLKNYIYSFSVINLMTIFGGLLISALLYDISFMQKAIEVPDIKIIMFLPLLLSLFIIFSLDEIKKFLQVNLTVKDLIIALIFILAAGIIYIRTGNNSIAWLNSDQTFRQFFENLLLIRPRTKEFLIGQPLLFLGLYFRKPLFIWIGMIAQVSIINSFMHIHTPLMISLIRTFYGIFLGIAIAYFVIEIYNLFAKIRAKLNV